MSGRAIIAAEYRARPWLWRIAAASVCSGIGQALPEVIAFAHRVLA